MFNRIRRCVFSCVALILLLPTTACAAEEVPPTASEPFGFEVIQDGRPAGWDVETADKGGWALTTETAHTGMHSIQFTGGGTEAGEMLHLRSASFSVQPGDAVRAQAWVNMPVDAQFRVQLAVEFRSGNSWEVAGYLKRMGRYDSQNKQWENFGARGIITPRNASEARLFAVASSREAEDFSVAIDDFSYGVASLRDYIAANQDAERLKNVMWFGVDTLRPESLGCYGGSVATPVIDALASEGEIFANVTTAAPWTKPSFASMFTSLYPSQHHAEEATTPLPDSMYTVAEAFRENGYFTVGFAHSTPDGYLGSNHGHAQGFDVWHQVLDEDELFTKIKFYLDLNMSALKGMKGGGLVIFYHMYEPHWDFVNRWPDLIVNHGKLGQFNFGQAMLDQMRKRPNSYTDADLEYAVEVYRWEAVHTDERIGQVLARLKWAGLYDELNVVITSDHGTVLPGEFPNLAPCGHGNTHEASTHVPIIIRFPGRTKASSTHQDSLASTLDIMPTLFDLAGFPKREEFEGESLLDRDRDGYTSRYGISEGKRAGWLSVRNGRYKLIVHLAAAAAPPEYEGQHERERLRTWTFGTPNDRSVYRLFDLHDDPGELNDIAQSQPELLQQLKDVLMEHCTKTGIIGGSSEPVEQRTVTDETREALEALGYVD